MDPLAASSDVVATIATAIEVAPGATRVQLFPGYGTGKGRLPRTRGDRPQPRVGPFVFT